MAATGTRSRGPGTRMAATGTRSRGPGTRMARPLLLLLCLLPALGSTSPTDRRNGKERRAGSCTREVCARARATLKVGSDCVKAPFCVRAMVKDLKKATKEKLRLLKSSGKERKCGGKLADPSVSSNPEKLEAGALARLREEGEQLVRQNTQLAEQVQSLSSQNRGFSSQKKALTTKNKGLISQTKELTLTNDDLKRQVARLKEKPSEEADGRQEVEEARTETKRWKERNAEVVESLERVETQYAMMGQKLGEAVEAMSMMQDRVERAKQQLNENNQQKLRLESTKAEVESELQVCSTRLASLGEVNSACRGKLGELEMCKDEITRLATVVDERFSQVKADREREKQLRIRAELAEAGLEEVKVREEELKSELERCDMRERKEEARVQELERRLEEAGGEMAQKLVQMNAMENKFEAEKKRVREKEGKVEKLAGRVKKVDMEMVQTKQELDELSQRTASQKKELDECIESKKQVEDDDPDKGRSCNSPCMISKLAGNDLIEMSKKEEENLVTEEKMDKETQ